MANFKTITFISMAVAGLIIAIICGTVRFAYLDKIIHSQVGDKMYLGNGTESWESFVKFPIPIKFSFYFFNVTNPQDFDGKSIRSLNIDLVGPYVYNETRSKENIVLDDDGNLVEYIERKSYVFDEIASDGRKDDDNIISFNIFLALSGDIVSSDVQDEFQDISWLYTPAGLKHMFVDCPDDTNCDVKVVVDTGKSNIDNIGQIVTYDNKTYLDNWLPFGSCNLPRGTDAVNFKPGLTEDDIVWAFEPMLCRSLFFKSKRMPNIEVRDIPTLRFILDDDNFDADLLENVCYCRDDFRKLDTFSCQSGLLTMRSCGNGMGKDIAATPPFFYSSPSMQEAANLTAPTPVNFENWGTILDIEPITGITLKALKKVQINILSDRAKNGLGVRTFEDHHIVLPMAIIEEAATVDEENANKLEDLVFKPRRLASGFLIAGLVIGIVMFIAGGALLYCLK